jgi:[phosphatase 2A protein]-leucine-carboxy methyltransferase
VIRALEPTFINMLTASFLGTYVRTTAIDHLINLFLNSSRSNTKTQIVSLGAGSDTRYFRLIHDHPSLVYHELDFDLNTRTKIASIRSSPMLQSRFQHSTSEKIRIDSEGASLHSSNYHIHPVDLRNLLHLSPDSLSGLDPTLPSLIVSECCLCYLSPADASTVLNHFTAAVFPPATPLAFVLYEPIRPFDPFGRTMVANLAARGIVLQTLQKYSSLAAQKERLRIHGFEAGQGAADVDFIWENWIDEREKERVARVEMLDEVEEWRMLARHYCVAWGWRLGNDAMADGKEAEDGKSWSWEKWETVPGQDGDGAGDGMHQTSFRP